ncbi:MAG: P27 family phage terminase small subunit [Clostridia bacterium]|nr:P27 family phage terminase small subunit [Clostridia bacterium]
MAAILEKRDEVENAYIESGEDPIVEYTNKGGSTNKVVNPALSLWDNLNKTALTYWRELGLTPSGYKKITGDKPKEEQKMSGLAAALASIES